MLYSDKSYRFTALEVASCDEIGLNLQGVTTPDAFAGVLTPWLIALVEVRPDLFDSFAREIAAAKGLSLPPSLRVVNSIPMPDCSGTSYPYEESGAR